MITVANGLRLTQIRPYGRRVLHRGPKHFSSSSQKSPEGSILARAWNRYTAALIARPLTVKASVASVIFFASDSATQYITDSTANWNPARALSGSVFGVVSTTWLHFWWGFLEGFVGKRIPVTNYRLRNTLVKVFVDQSMVRFIYFERCNKIEPYDITRSLCKESQHNSVPLSLSLFLRVCICVM